MSAQDKRYLVVIAGPTAVGKTDLAIRLALTFNTEIISADSRQFYREMNIGTAKPGPEQLSLVQHHFINSHSIDQLYGAGHFARDAEQLLHTLFEKKPVVILAGGSGLYIEALLEGVDEFGVQDAGIREEIIRNYKLKGLAWLQEQVQQLDPRYYEEADRQNPQRLMRALEVCLQTGQPYSTLRQKGRKKNNYEVIPLLVTLPRDLLYERINQRVDQMVEQGLVEEVRLLRQQMHQNALKTVGYRELADHFDGKLSMAEAIAKIKQHTRNYAKRQLTWFRNRGQFSEFDVRDEAGIEAFIRQKMT